MQTMQQLATLSVGEIAPLIAARKVSPVEVTRAMLERIERYNAAMRVYITVTGDGAMAQAKQAEAAILAGSYLGPMHGIPISLKDNIATRGIRTSGASLVKQWWVPEETATVAEKLASAGAVLLGKANLAELAFGGQHEEYGAPLNPWNAEYSAAGSSSGSGAGVASFLAYGSVGTDTGGSIRGPANNNGCVGLKPTYGLVSRHGVIPASWSLDHVGPLARTARDCAYMLQAMAGYDPKDPQSSPAPTPDFAAALTGDIRGLRVGVVTGFPIAPTPEVAGLVAAATSVLRGLGATTREVTLPYVEHVRHLYTAVVNPEIATYHGDNLRSNPHLFSEFVRERMDMGLMVTATQYLTAQRVRQVMIDAFQDLLGEVDVLVGPASPVPPGKQGERNVVIDGMEVPARVAGAGYTNVYNLTGMPALVLPCGFAKTGLPVGLQIAARWFEDATVLRVADAYESETGWLSLRPPLPEAL